MTSVLRRGIIGENVVKSGWSPSVRWETCTRSTSGLGVQTIVMVKRVRQLWNQTTVETVFYLSSLPCDVGRIAHAIRAHWGIENQLHWVLDVTFGEDACRIRTGHGPR